MKQEIVDFPLSSIIIMCVLNMQGKTYQMPGDINYASYGSLDLKTTKKVADYLHSFHFNQIVCNLSNIWKLVSSVACVLHNVESKGWVQRHGRGKTQNSFGFAFNQYGINIAFQ